MAGKVRILKEKLFKFKEDDTKLSYVEGACDNDATPPQGNFVTGSAFENVTSGNKYKYSETSGDWVLQPSEGGGTGGGVLVVIADEPMANPPSWVTDIFDNYLIYETNVTYAQCHGAFVLGLSTPANSGIFYRNRSQMIAEFMDFGFVEDQNTYIVYAQAYKYAGRFSQIELHFIANAEDGMLYCIVENQN